MKKRAVKKISNGCQADMRMRLDINPLPRQKFNRSHLIEKNKWPDHLPLGQGPCRRTSNPSMSRARELISVSMASTSSPVGKRTPIQDSSSSITSSATRFTNIARSRAQDLILTLKPLQLGSHIFVAVLARVIDLSIPAPADPVHKH